MAVLERLVVQLTADTDEFERRFDRATSMLSTTGQKMARIGGRMTAAVSLPLAGVGAAAFKMAADAEESANKFNVVMGDAADEVRQRLQALTETVPLTRAQMEGLAAGVQDMLVPMGVARDEAAGMSADMVALAGDLASFNNVSAAEVLEGIQSALAGSSEPMRRYGVDTRVARLEALALEEGLIQQGQAMDNAATAQAVLLAIQRDSTDAMGDAGRTVDSASNSMKFFQRNVRQLTESVGTELLPILTPLLQRAQEAIGRFAAMDAETRRMVVTIGAAAVAAGPLLLVLGKLTTSTGALIGVLKPLALALGLPLGPLALVVAGAGTLAAALVVAYQRSETFRDIVNKAFSAVAGVVKSVVGSVGGILSELAEAFMDVAEEIVETVDRLLIEPVLDLWRMWGDEITAATRIAWDAVTSVLRGAWEAIKGIVSGALSVVSNTIQLALNVIQGDWREAWENVRGIFAGFRTAIEGIVRGMVEAITGVLRAGFDLFSGIVQAGVDRITGAFERMKRVIVGNSIVPDMVDLIGDEFVRMGGLMDSETAEATKSVGQRFTDLVGMIQDKVGPLPDWMEQAFGRIKAAVTIQNVGDTIQSWVKFVTELVSLLSDLWDIAKKVGGEIGKLGFNQGGLTFGGSGPTGPGYGGSLPPGAGNFGSGGSGGFANLGDLASRLDLVHARLQDLFLVLDRGIKNNLVLVRNAVIEGNTQLNWIQKNTRALADALAGGVAPAPVAGVSPQLLGAGAGGGTSVTVQFLAPVTTRSDSELADLVASRTAEEVDRTLGDRREVDRIARGEIRTTARVT